MSLMRLTPDDVHHDPVRGGVGGHAGVVAAGAGAGVGHRQPALETRDNQVHSNKNNREWIICPQEF